MTHISSQILYWFSVLLWIFPAIRQRKNNFFFYFLILAVSDPINLFVIFILKLNPYESTFVYLSYLLFISILENRVIKKYWLVLFTPLVVIIITSLSSNLLDTNSAKLVFLLLHTLIFSIILRLFATKQSENGEIHLFLIVLLFYELTIILKVVGITFGFENATANYIITTIFQIAFGLFFSIFRKDNTRLIFKL